MMNSSLSRHRGFTIMELVIAFGLLASFIALVSQTAYWSMKERGNVSSRQAALETAANFLERAGSLPFDELTADWAAKQKLDDTVLSAEAVLAIHVETEKAAPRTKRVSVRIGYPTEPGVPLTTVELVGLFSDRMAPAKGDQP